MSQIIFKVRPKLKSASYVLDERLIAEIDKISKKVKLSKSEVIRELLNAELFPSFSGLGRTIRRERHGW